MIRPARPPAPQTAPAESSAANPTRNPRCRPRPRRPATPAVQPAGVATWRGRRINRDYRPEWYQAWCAALRAGWAAPIAHRAPATPPQTRPALPHRPGCGADAAVGPVLRQSRVPKPSMPGYTGRTGWCRQTLVPRAATGCVRPRVRPATPAPPWCGPCSPVGATGPHIRPTRPPTGRSVSGEHRGHIGHRHCVARAPGLHSIALPPPHTALGRPARCRD